MDASHPVNIPLINPNEPEARLAALHVSEGDRVTTGQPLCTLETTKATQEVQADASGYVIGIQAQEGATVRAGDLLCYLAESPEWQPPAPQPLAASDSTGESGEVPPGVRITQPALALARQEGLDLSVLPVGPLVTAGQVRALLARRLGQTEDAPSRQNELDSSAILVYGGGGHGKSVLDLLAALGTYRVVGVVDDGLPAGEPILGVPVLGGAEVLAEQHARGVRQAVNAVGGIGDLTVRVLVFERLALAGFTCPTVVHPTAFQEPGARLDDGVQVFPHAYVGSDVQVGFGAIVNTGAIVSHDCTLGEYANLSPGAILAGGVQIGPRVLIGMGATINLGVRVGAGARVGNGATVKSDVPAGGVVPAGGIWPPAAS